MNNFNFIKDDVKNFRKNKNNCNDNIDYVYSFLSRTKDLVESIIEFGEFKHEEYKENIKQLKENERKYLESGDD